MRMREIRELMRNPPRERDRVQRRLSRCHDIDDLRDAARRMLPRAVSMQLRGVSTLPALRRLADQIVVPAIATSGVRRTDRRIGGTG